MSWKCNICDSYNEDDSSQCYACGQPKTSQPIAKKTDTEKSVPDVTRINVEVDEPVRVKSSHTGFTFCAVLGVLLWIGWIALTVCSIAALLFFTGIPFHFCKIAYMKSWKSGTWGWFISATVFLLILLIL